MVIQKVIKGIGGIDHPDVDKILQSGILCQWWREVGTISADEIPQHLTERNLNWHQNHYDEPDPHPSGEPFYKHTPFISTTAGTVERDVTMQTNLLIPAWIEALHFATNSWSRDGYLFYCYVFILSKKAVGHQAFAEELRDLNTYTGFSPFQPEGEITAKIVISPAQIEKVEFWSISKWWDDLMNLRMPSPANVISNPLYLPAENYHNIRDTLH